MEFSPAIYKRLLGFYEDKFEVSRGNELQGQRSNLSQAEILYQGWDFVKKNLSILSDFLRQEKLLKKSWANLKNFTSRMTKLKFFQNWLTIFGVSFSGETKSKRIERFFFHKIPSQVACQWLNDDWKDDYYHNRKNYERWTNNGVKKKVLKLAGIFPISGDRYTAPELVPGKIMTFSNVTAVRNVLI